MDDFFPTNDFSLLESCQLYTSASYKASNCCKKRSYPEVIYKKGVLKNHAKFTGKPLCQHLFFDKVAA